MRYIDVESKEFEKWLNYRLLKDDIMLEGKYFSMVLKAAISKATYEGKEITTFQRIARKNEVIYYDLNNSNSEIVKVTTDGFSIERNGTNVPFLQNSTMLEQVKPKLDAEIEDVSRIKKYVTLNETDYKLFLILLITSFIEDISHPLLIINGSQGSAKSTLTRIYKKIVDPTIVEISAMPHKKEDLTLQLEHEYTCCFDNLVSIKNDVSNIMCMAITGGAHAKRKLYTNSDMVIYSFRRCIVLNGISWLSSQSDLLDRSIIVNLDRIKDQDRKTDEKIFNGFKQDLPYILGGIFKTLSKAMEIQPDLKVENLPRLADFGTWGYAVAEVLGIGGEEFLKLYKDNQTNITREILFSNPVAYALFEFMKKRLKHECSIEQLYTELCDIADTKNINKNDTMWARSPAYLSRRLNQLKVNLEQEKIFFDIKNVGSHKQIVLENKNLKPPKIRKKKKKSETKKLGDEIGDHLMQE